MNQFINIIKEESKVANNKTMNKSKFLPNHTQEF